MDYNQITGSTKFIRPIDPGTFMPVRLRSVGTRAAPTAPISVTEIIAQKIVHDDQKHLYNEVQATKISLRNQVIEDIGSK